MKKNLVAKEKVDFKLLEKRIGRKIEEEDFIVPPIVDSTFKYLFGTEKNKDCLKDLLKAILEFSEEELAEISYKNVELVPDLIDDKKIFLDVRVKLQSGEEIDIEIQRIRTKDLHARFLYYWSRMFVNQAKVGWKYRDLKKCISINILDFKMTEGEACHSVYHLYEDRNLSLFSDMMEIHLIELPKLETVQEENKNLYDWLRFLKTSSRKEMREMSEMNPRLKKAMERMLDYSLDGDTQLRAIKEYNHLLDEIYVEEMKAEAQKEAQEKGLAEGRERGLAEGRERGLAEGRAEGRVQVALEIGKKLKENKVDIEMIMEYTGLPREEIEKL